MIGERDRLRRPAVSLLGDEFLLSTWEKGRDGGEVDTYEGWTIQICQADFSYAHLCVAVPQLCPGHSDHALQGRAPEVWPAAPHHL